MKHPKIFAIGAGGSGMSGLIRLLKQRGYKVYGSDQGTSSKVEELRKEGISIYSNHSAGNITSDLEEVIYSQAVPEDNPERREAERLGIPQYSYPEALGRHMEDQTKICIAGTHGKTTTTAMIAACFIRGRKDPTVIVGADVKELDNKNERLGWSKLAVLETCEYKKSFLSIPPDILVITNIDFDHVDFYKTKKNYDEAFLTYMKMVPKNGCIFYMQDDIATRNLLRKVKGVMIKPIAVNKTLKLSVPGEHNRRNASLAYNVARSFHVSESDAKKALQGFSGTKRRLEYKGKHGKTKIYDDYGHHPTEIRATLNALRELYPKEKILTIFQPHQFSRTTAFLEEFKHAFAKTDAVIIPNIYEARDTEKDKSEMSLDKLVTEISKHHPNVTSGQSITETTKTAKELAKSYDVIITMGAGDVYKVADALATAS